MHNNDFERIMAYHDGELDAEEAAHIEALIERDDQAKAFLEELRQTDRFVQEGLSGVLEEDIPDRLLNAARGATESAPDTTVVPFPRRWFSGRRGLAAAASVLVMVGVGVSTVFFSDRNEAFDPPVAHLLDTTLESTPSGELREDVDSQTRIMPVATFNTREQGVCREFALRRDSESVYGLACRQSNGDWRTVARQDVTAPSDAAESTYTPASGDRQAIDDKLKALGGEDPMTRNEEREWMDGLNR